MSVETVTLTGCTGSVSRFIQIEERRLRTDSQIWNVKQSLCKVFILYYYPKADILLSGNMVIVYSLRFHCLWTLFLCLRLVWVYITLYMKVMIIRYGYEQLDLYRTWLELLQSKMLTFSIGGDFCRYVNFFHCDWWYQQHSCTSWLYVQFPLELFLVYGHASEANPSGIYCYIYHCGSDDGSLLCHH